MLMLSENQLSNGLPKVYVENINVHVSPGNAIPYMYMYLYHIHKTSSVVLCSN